MSNIGEEDSTASITLGSLLKVAINDPIGPRDGVAAQTITQGRRPRITNTAKKSPQTRNHRLAFFPIVESTSALMMALSTLLMTSKRQSPATVKNIAKKSIRVLYQTIFEKKQSEMHYLFLLVLHKLLVYPLL